MSTYRLQTRKCVFLFYDRLQPKFFVHVNVPNSKFIWFPNYPNYRLNDDDPWWHDYSKLHSWIHKKLSNQCFKSVNQKHSWDETLSFVSFSDSVRNGFNYGPLNGTKPQLNGCYDTPLTDIDNVIINQDRKVVKIIEGKNEVEIALNENQMTCQAKVFQALSIPVTYVYEEETTCFEFKEERNRG